MNRVAVAAVAAISSGCSTFDYDWHQTMVPIPRERWKYEYVADVGEVCKLPEAQNLRSHACAIRRPDGLGDCRLIFQRDYQLPGSMVHEERHCQGWTHP